MQRFHWLALTSCVLGISPVTFGFQESPPSVPEIPAPAAAYDAEIPEVIDPLDGEAAAESRIQDDASRLAELAGEELGDQMAELLRVLFDSSKDDDERLAAGSDLQSLFSDVDTRDRQLFSVAKQVNRRVRLVTAGVSGLRQGPADGNARELMNEFLIRTAVDFENSNREAYSAEARRLYRQLKQTHPVLYTHVRQAVIEDYFNYNLHIVISEPMMSMLVSDFQTESGSIADCILGAWVTGSQTTDTMVTVDIKPSVAHAQFDLIADGRTISKTRGRKKPATIYSHGNHEFQLTKTVHFDGQSLYGDVAQMSVDPNNRTVGVSTDYDRIPILGGIARRIAFRKSEELKGQSEAIAARKLADQALPKFESEVGTKFAEANSNLRNNFRADLEKRGIAPESYSARSSDTHIAMSTRTINPETMSASDPPESPAPRRGLVVQAHESVINAAMSSLGLSGPTTPIELIETVEAALEDLTDRDLAIRRPEEKQKQTDFDFEAEDPIRVRFDENRIVLLFRTGFYQYDKGAERPSEPTLDKQVFEIPIDIAFEDGEIVMTPPPLDDLQKFGSMIKNRPADSNAAKGVGALRRTIQARKIAQELVSAVFSDPENPDVIVRDKRVPAAVKIQMGDGARLPLRVTRFQISDGWLTAVLQK